MTTIRLVPDQPNIPLAAETALGIAQPAYAEARAAQLALVSGMRLTSMLFDKTSVTHIRARLELREARQQAERAGAVVDALETVVDAFERARA